jgi:hypothetical protein
MPVTVLAKAVVLFIASAKGGKTSAKGGKTSAKGDKTSAKGGKKTAVNTDSHAPPLAPNHRGQIVCGKRQNEGRYSIVYVEKPKLKWTYYRPIYLHYLFCVLKRRGLNGGRLHHPQCSRFVR